MIAKPGKVAIHGAEVRYSRPLDSMFPQLGTLGGTLNPKNPNPAS